MAFKCISFNITDIKVKTMVILRGKATCNTVLDCTGKMQKPSISLMLRCLEKVLVLVILADDDRKGE